MLCDQVVEDKTGKDRVYTKWKPPRNKLTQEIQRKKGAERKSVVSESSGDLTRCVVKVSTVYFHNILSQFMMQETEQGGLCHDCCQCWTGQVCLPNIFL